MKARHFLPFLFLWMGLSTTVRAADISSTTIRGQIADWPFLQSVGGIQIGKTLQEQQHAWSMELLCDLSGHQTFTQKPTNLDSGMMIQKTQVDAKDNDIFISLLVSHVLWTSNPDKARCKGLTIESTPGFHQIFYRDAIGNTFPLGHVEFNKDSEVLNSNPG